MAKINEFDSQFRLRLQQEIAEIEKNSAAEVVLIVRSRSDTYRDVSLWNGFVLQIIVVAFLLFSPIVFNPYWICFISLVSFLAGFFAVELIKPLKRKLIKNERMNKATEIYARAIFQKGQLYDTRDQTGLLIFVSLFEQKIRLIPDKGLITKMPVHIWQDLEDKFNSVFDENEMLTDAIIKKMSLLRSVLAQYVPPREDDINEIPDDLRIDL